MLYGFDVGGTKVAFSVYDHALHCQFSDQCSTPDDYDELLKLMASWVYLADKKFACKGLVGVGFPGTLSKQDLHVFCANVKAIQGRAFIKDLNAMLERDVQYENDANCFLLSECLAGSADGCNTVLGITLGTGIGGAICINGKTLTGKNAFAAEIGHYPIPATILKSYSDLPIFVCGCGREMCLEAYVSGTGLTHLYQHYSGDSLKAQAIIEKYRVGDETAKTVLSIYFEILTAGIATSVLVLDPDAIVLGGGLSKFDILIDEVIKRLPKHLLSGVNLPIIKNAKYGAEGGVRGAALLNYKALPRL